MINLDLKSHFHTIVFAMTVLGILAVYIFVYAVVTDTTGIETKQEAIDRGYALYCPKNGEFAWKGECE